ncbi:MAG: UvrD-helicase domain-containing protein [Gammaproteobacteria bacterium]|nr:UvrD-helicase domain-containing protein [Gammaproteobacteria bacterium]
MDYNIIDADERSQALDVKRSFIVQAPAGSGKTELLIQRILSLLAYACEEPEHIVSITFTRKAAAEMRKRLLSALMIAQTQPEPEQPHALVTWTLARKVLEVDAQKKWQLLQNPNRLRLQTIDSLCANIARSAPYLSQFGSEPSVFSDPTPYYQQAARELMKQLSQDSSWQPALARLLLHLDNDWNTVQKMLTSMLGRRDQWLAHLLEHNDLESKRHALELSLEHVITDTLELSVDLFPQHCQSELLFLLRSAATVLSQIETENPFETFLDQADFPAANVDDLSAWQTIANFLLTQTGDWRKSFTTAQGFLAPSATKIASEKEQRIRAKQRLEDLISELKNHEELHQLLLEIQQLPPPKYSDEQWQILSDLVILLPILAAQLQLVFREHHGVDFIEVATRARLALGSADNPTEMALNWDYRIRHLLVDEFQDTSTPQFHLIELLTAGWQPNDGRTLFLVGDPMQSIYRFREAEVGLFLRAQLQGINDIALTPLQLTVNFRSKPQIIEWINSSFQTLFPAQDEMSVGAVTYAPSHSPEQSEEGNVAVHPLINSNTDEEAQKVVSIIDKTREENPESRVAILVRARHHAAAIFVALQRKGLRYQAQDMEKMSHRAVIQDCFALTRALLHPADRIAWLAVLRAPWCGLSLADLLVITQAAGSGVLWSVIEQFETIENFTEDAKTRLTRVVPILQQALSQRGRLTLRNWIHSTWKALGGLSCIKQSADFQNADRYFALLDQLSPLEMYDFSLIENQLNNLFATVDPESDDRLQIMTMHKAKGLEFDVVILPGLERTAKADSAQLLLWWERPRPDAQADLILGPIKPTASLGDSIYNYLRFQDACKSQYEITRVLYVAATRAKKALHLLGNVEISDEEVLSLPPQDSFLRMLWPHIEHEFHQAKDIHSVPDIIQKSVKNMARLPADFQNPDKTQIVGVIVHQDSPINEELSTLPDWSLDQTAEHIGTVIHRMLERIANEGLQRWQNFNSIDHYPLWETQLQQLGVAHSEIQSSLEIISDALVKTLADEKGRWILSQHAESHSEYPITLVQNNEVVHCIIDRTFVDNEGQRWIIDYKSAIPKAEQMPDAFLLEAFHYHASQLHLYAKAFSCLEQRPIQLALYFPRSSLFYAWNYEAIEA